MFYLEAYVCILQVSFFSKLLTVPFISSEVGSVEQINNKQTRQISYNHVVRILNPLRTPMLVTSTPCSYGTTPPSFLSHHPVPVLTLFCQTTIFAHLRQRAAGFVIEHSAAFESDRRRRAAATGRHRNTGQRVCTQERGRPCRVTDMLTQTHKQKWEDNSGIFLH